MTALRAFALSVLGLLACTPIARAQGSEETRVAVSIGSNYGLPGEAPLEYAEEDARRVRDVAVQLGGVRPERAYLLTASTASEVMKTLAIVRGRLEELAARGPTALLLYVSAHGDAESVHLSGTRLSLAELRATLAQLPTRFRLVIVDACQTAVPGRSKGGTPGPDVPVVLKQQGDAAGEVFIASASAGEPAQEWSYLGGALFTHHLLAALRGVADFDLDGNISLTEAYSYAYRHTVADAALASAQPQRPRFDFQFSGFGDFRVTHPGRDSAAVVLGADLIGRFLIIDSEQKLLVDLTKSEAAPVRIALPQGFYRVVHPEARVVRASDLNLGWGGTRELHAHELVEVPHYRTRLRGSEPLVLRPYRVRLGYDLASGSLAGVAMQHWLELGGAYQLRRGFVELGLLGSLAHLSSDQLSITQREARVRAAGGARISFGMVSLLVGAESQLAFAQQHVTRDHPQEVARVFNKHEPARHALWLGLGGVVGAELALSERWFFSLAASVGMQRIFAKPSEVRALYVQGRGALGYSF